MLPGLGIPEHAPISLAKTATLLAATDLCVVGGLGIRYAMLSCRMGPYRGCRCRIWFCAACQHILAICLHVARLAARITNHFSPGLLSILGWRRANISHVPFPSTPEGAYSPIRYCRSPSKFACEFFPKFILPLPLAFLPWATRIQLASSESVTTEDLDGSYLYADSEPSKL